MWFNIINYTLIRLAVTLQICMDERGLVFSPSFPDPALLHLGLEALWDFARLVLTARQSFPGHENVAKHRRGVDVAKANERHARFQPTNRYSNQC